MANKEGDLSPENESIFKQIAEYTYDWETWMDPNGKALWINPAVERITGYTVQECLENEDYPLFLVHSEDRTLVADALEHAQKHIQGNHLEFRVKNRNGTIRWVAMSWQDLLDDRGQYRGYRTSVRDVTARKRAEEEMLLSHDDARKASRAKGEFLAHMSHEIRTPIHNIFGLTQVLQQTDVDDRQTRLLSTLGDECEALLKMVDDVLDFSVLQSSSPRLERVPFNVAKIVRGVADGVEQNAKAAGLELRVEIQNAADVVVLGDVYRLRQVLGNLIGNAIKFTPEGSIVVRVDAEAMAPADKTQFIQVSFEVEDTGIGIPPDQVKQLFEPFTQADASIRRRFGGSGLGLTISRRLIELMSGNLSVRSAPDSGSTFVATIPFVVAQVDASADEAAKVIDPIGSLNVLVVDDGVVAREVTQELLQSLGHHADAAANAQQAISALHEKAYHVVLMDKRMPEIDGLTLTRMIRSDSQIDQPYIVAVTANATPETRERCLRAGMDEFLGKPVRLNELQRTLANRERRPTGAVPAAPAAPKQGGILNQGIVKQLQLRSSDGTTILEKTRPMILQDLDHLIDELKAYSIPIQHQALQQTAHAAAGSLRTIGADEPAQVAQELENAPADSSNDFIVDRIQVLVDLIEKTAAELQSL